MMNDAKSQVNWVLSSMNGCGDANAIYKSIVREWQDGGMNLGPWEETFHQMAEDAAAGVERSMT